MLRELAVGLGHHHLVVRPGALVRGRASVVGHDQLRDPADEGQRVHVRLVPGLLLHVAERLAEHQSGVRQRGDKEVGLSDVPGHGVHHGQGRADPVHEHCLARFVLQRRHDVGGGGEPVEQFAVLRVAVFLPLTGRAQVFDPALLQREEPVVFHLFDDLGEMRVREVLGDGLAPVREELFDVRCRH